MRKNWNLLRWLPSIILMAFIFGFSSIPAQKLPDFGELDRLAKKSAHIFIYGLLALTFWYAIHHKRRYWWLAILLAVLYAITDEYHQSFVMGRHPSWIDVLFFDGGGATFALGAALGVQRIKSHPK